MKIKTIRIKRSFDIPPERERDVKGMILTLALFAFGMIVGAGLLKSGSSDFIRDFTSVFDLYTEARNSQKIYTVFFHSIAVNTLFLVSAFGFGLSCIGLPVTVLLPVVKGLGMGIVSGYLFSHFAMSGIGYYLLTIFPGAVLTNSALLLACNASSLMSIDILATVTSRKPADTGLVKNYLKKYLILLIVTLTGSLIDAVLTRSFSYLFSV